MSETEPKEDRQRELEQQWTGCMMFLIKSILLALVLTVPVAAAVGVWVYGMIQEAILVVVMVGWVFIISTLTWYVVTGIVLEWRSERLGNTFIVYELSQIIDRTLYLAIAIIFLIIFLVLMTAILAH